MIKSQEKTFSNNEISISDLIAFLKNNLLRFILFSILGGIVGTLYEKFAAPTYEGTALVSLAVINSKFIIDPPDLALKSQMNSYFSEKTLSDCNPELNPNKNREFRISDNLRVLTTRGGNYLKITMQSEKKESIYACFDSAINDINIEQKKILEAFTQNKKNMLAGLEKLMQSSKSVGLDNQIAMLASEIKIIEIKDTLADLESREIGLNFPIDIKKKSFPYITLGFLLGMFLGIVLEIAKKKFK